MELYSQDRFRAAVGWGAAKAQSTATDKTIQLIGQDTSEKRTKLKRDIFRFAEAVFSYFFFARIFFY